MDCVFCKIIAGELPSEKVFENEHVLAFRDIAPQAPVHVILVPKQHIVSVNEINRYNSPEIAELFRSIPKIADKCGLTNGYRVITNVGPDGCQSVEHMHFHILGGKKLSEKLD